MFRESFAIYFRSGEQVTVQRIRNGNSRVSTLPRINAIPAGDSVNIHIESDEVDVVKGKGFKVFFGSWSDE